MKNNIFIYLFLLPLLVFSQEDNISLFEKAAQYYNQGEYQNAIDQYKLILKSGKESTALYYNLANTYYKLNHVPESIYYYEKALQLNPNNQEAKNGLLLANQMKIDAIVPLPKTWLRQLSDAITGLFSLQTWAILSIIGIMVFVLSFFCYYFLEQTALKRLFFTLMFMSVAVAVGTYFIADFHKKQIEGEKYAILFDKTVRVFSEANSYSSEVVQLHEGTKVEIIEKNNDWIKIRLANGKIGWTKESTLKVL
ncbi:BatE protein [Capnocytophaga sp. HP1101]